MLKNSIRFSIYLDDLKESLGQIQYIGTLNKHSKVEAQSLNRWKNYHVITLLSKYLVYSFLPSVLTSSKY